LAAPNIVDVGAPSWRGEMPPPPREPEPETGLGTGIMYLSKYSVKGSAGPGGAGGASPCHSLRRRRHRGARKPLECRTEKQTLYRARSGKWG
jgi:hypothetical protein